MEFSHKKNEILPFAATGMQLEIIIPSEVRKRQTLYIICIWNLKHATNKPIYKTETDSQTERTDLWLSVGKGVWEGRTGSVGLTDANYYI